MAEKPGQSEAALPEVTAWIDLQWVEPAQAMLDAMAGSVRLVAVAGPRVAEVSQLARSYDVPHLDDPRQLLVDHPSSFWLTTSMKLISLEDLARAMEQGTQVLSLEPFIEQMSDPDELSRKQTALRKQRSKAAVISAGHLVMLGSLVESPGFLATAGALDMIGTQRLLRIESVGPASQRSMFARLYDVWRSLLLTMPLPETIDASLADPQAIAPSPGKLATFSGRMAAHARIPDGGAAIIAVSDQHPTEHAVLALSGSGGSMRITPDSYQLHLYESDEKEAGDVLLKSTTATDLGIWQWQRLMSRPQFTPADPRAALNEEVLACCQACLLSARTREPERPDKFIRLIGG